MLTACAGLLAVAEPGALLAAPNGTAPSLRKITLEMSGGSRRAPSTSPGPGRNKPALHLRMTLEWQTAEPAHLPAFEPPAAGAAMPSSDPLSPMALLAPLLQGARRHEDGNDSTHDAELLAVRINAVEQNDTVLALRLAGGDIALPLDAWLGWSFKRPAEPLLVDGREYAPLAAVSGLRWHIDGASQTLAIEAPASAFVRHEFGVTPETLPTQSSGLGGFVNYDLLFQRDGSAERARTTQQASALLEAGFFGFGGTGRSTGLWRTGDGGSRFTRLDTQWTIDRPDAMSSLRFGDSVSLPGSWGRALRFGGVQWATNFAVRPGFVTMPMPGVRGEAALPSVLDLYVNNIRQRQADLPPGPFDLPDVPVVTGPGEVKLVVRDALGREQVIVQPYYVSPLLLKPGLHEFAVEAGAVREDYGLSSERYGEALFTATDRYGVNPTFTREVRAEVLRSSQALGATGVWLLRDRGTGHLSAAASHGSGGAGWLVGGGMDTQRRNWSGNLQLSLASRNFTQMGQSTVADAATPRLTAGVGASTSIGAGGLSVNLLMQTTWQQGRYRSLNLNYGTPLGALGYLAVFATRTSGSGNGWSAGLNLIKPLGDRDGSSNSASIGSYRSHDRIADDSLPPTGAGPLARDLPARESLVRDNQQTTVQLQSSPPVGPGFGYQLQAEAGSYQRLQAEGQWQTERVTLAAGAARSGSANAYRLGASGGVALMPEGVFMSRRIEGSFAVVKVGDYADVRVERDNQPVARTDAQGLALVTGLRGYEANRIGVEAADLPLDAQVDAVALLVAPGARSGVSVHFPVHRVRSASLRLVMANGEPVPPGSWARVEGGEKEFPVGFDGRLFLVGVAERSRIKASWGEQHCSAEIALAGVETVADEVPELGTQPCH